MWAGRALPAGGERCKDVFFWMGLGMGVVWRPVGIRGAPGDAARVGRVYIEGSNRMACRSAGLLGC